MDETLGVESSSVSLLGMYAGGTTLMVAGGSITGAGVAEDVVNEDDSSEPGRDAVAVRVMSSCRKQINGECFQQHREINKARANEIFWAANTNDHQATPIHRRPCWW